MAGPSSAIGPEQLSPLPELRQEQAHLFGTFCDALQTLVMVLGIHEFERRLQTIGCESNNIAGVPFLHSSLRPLDSVDFSTEEERGQTNLFGNECEGMCGV